MSYTYNNRGQKTSYTDHRGYNFGMDGSYRGRRESDGYNTNSRGQRSSYNGSDGYKYSMSGERKGYWSGNTFYGMDGRPKYHKG